MKGDEIMARKSIDMYGSNNLYVIKHNTTPEVERLVFFHLEDALDQVLEIKDEGGSMKACEIRVIDIWEDGEPVDLHHEMLAYMLRQRDERIAPT
jgi:hypothetical protein